MVEETAPVSEISTTFKWTYAVHHIVDHALLARVEGLRESLARLGIYQESRGNKLPLLFDVSTAAEVANMADGAVRSMLQAVGFGAVAHPDNHTYFSKRRVGETHASPNHPTARTILACPWVSPTLRKLE